MNATIIKDTVWFFDSGCNNHITRNMEIFNYGAWWRYKGERFKEIILLL